ncbi:hypothetical protein GCM10023166_05830 [Paeniglutamicibacter cryotolerans]|uniref:Uncharacterized protein n=1 Tax=Paeniglutamicibacter cryotolerans TaxID=670079 RepID=A0A839QP86_9MICC|nr:hypothetical protein [Paeniglutamicibacter cryotolerans]
MVHGFNTRYPDTACAFTLHQCNDPTSRIYDERKRSEGKKHNQILIALAPPTLQRALRDAT